MFANITLTKNNPKLLHLPLRFFKTRLRQYIKPWHYRHKQYVRMLKEKGVQQSMSRKGNCYDNSVMENFFGQLKSELLYLQEFESMEHFKEELIEYMRQLL